MLSALHFLDTRQSGIHHCADVSFILRWQDLHGILTRQRNVALQSITGVMVDNIQMTVPDLIARTCQRSDAFWYDIQIMQNLSKDWMYWWSLNILLWTFFSDEVSFFALIGNHSLSIFINNMLIDDNLIPLRGFLIVLSFIQVLIKNFLASVWLPNDLHQHVYL